MLEERAKTAFDLYKSGLVKKLLVSGDNRTATYNEVMPIRKYLLESGVPADDIFTDFAGLNTYDSMYRARKIFGATDVLVVSQSFHLPRAIYAARNVGLNAYGVPADIEGSYFRNNTREIFATAKTFFKVVTQAESLFLGREISIEGDGRDSLR
jgi:SanA protein